MGMSSDKLLTEIKRITFARIEADRLILPSLSLHVGRCLELLSSGNVSFRTLTAVLEKDPLLAIQVVRLANSAAYGGMGGVKSIEQAVSRLGTQKLRSVLIETSTRQLFQSRDPRISEANRAVWEHSVAVGVIARDVAGLAGYELVDEAYLTGLLHDVGKPIVGAMLLEAEKMITSDTRQPWIDGDAWISAIQECHRPVGALLAERWNLPPMILKSIRDAVDYDSVDRISVPNIVLFANALAKREGIYPGAIARDDVDATVMIGRSLLGLDEEVVGRIANGLRERVKSHVE
jgi:HD-like signal output (HDOD) protein